MAKTTLADVVYLKSAIAKRIGELIQERDRVSTVRHVKGEEPEFPTRSFADVTAELYQTQQDLRTVNRLVREGNRVATVTWNGEPLTVAEALELADDLRKEGERLKNFGKRQKVEREGRNAWDKGSSDMMVRTNYDPDPIREKGEKMERVARKLSLDIDRANLLVEIDFDTSRYLGTEEDAFE